MIELIKAIIYGIVEGISEWLPISSTGHLILLEQLLPLKQSANFMEMFRVVIQLGAILAVVVIYFKKLWPLDHSNNKITWKLDKVRLWLKIIIACIPAAIIGILFDDLIDHYLYTPLVVALSLIVFGIGFIVVEHYNKRKHNQTTTLKKLTLKQITIIGLFQVLAAIFPGTSRSGATILGGILMGVSRPVAAEFTFFLGIPVMFGASLLKIIKFGFNFKGFEIQVLLIASIVSFIVSLAVIKMLMRYIQKNSFTIFGYYRIALGVTVLLYFFILR